MLNASTESAIHSGAPDRRQVGVHAWPYGGVEPRLTILRAKDNVNDDPTE
jgi:hypothetical protein